MSKAIFVQYRGHAPKNLSVILNEICRNLEPDNIRANEPKIYVSNNTGYGILNPPENLSVKDGSFALGKIFKDDKNWYFPKSEVPDGSFAIIRSDNRYVELLSDVLASRTIWYYFDKDIFIAATSQRAIIMLLQSFEFNDKVIPWLLTTGTLGPSNSWDKRIKKVEADTSLILDKEFWNIEEKSSEVNFNCVLKDNENCKKNILNSITHTFENLSFNTIDWVLPLSGGVDSRGLFGFLVKEKEENKKIKTVTWGLHSTIDQKGSDAYVAKKLTQKFDIANEFMPASDSNESIETILERFLNLGEGRIDHFSAYLDGFNIWKNLFENNISGIIRGDEGFGMMKIGNPLNEKSARIAVGCILANDFKNNNIFPSNQSQELPVYFLRNKGESLATYRDRLYHQYRHSVILSSLADLKLSFVEISNPFISKKIISTVRTLPDKMRTKKKVFKQIVDSFFPNIEYANFQSTADEFSFLSNEKFCEVIFEGIRQNPNDMFDENFIQFLIKNIKVSNKNTNLKRERHSIKKIFKKIMPSIITDLLKGTLWKPKMNLNQLAFRTFIVCKMHEKLEKDSKLFHS